MDKQVAERLAQNDYEEMRSKLFLNSVRTFFSRENNSLLSFSEVKDRLRLKAQRYRGIKEIPVEKIIGSENRWEDFDMEFLPKNESSRERWKSIHAAWQTDKKLPPIRVYKVGDSYFVQDGNHRVSVARQSGINFIDAEVIEFDTKVPIDSNLDWRLLAIKEEYVEFLEITKLDKLRPEQNIEFTIIGGYRKLIEHIEVHKFYLEKKGNCSIKWDTAVLSWYDYIYCWLRDIIIKQNILKFFNKRTVADLYLWIIEHQHYLSSKAGEEVRMEDAAKDFKDKYNEKPVEKTIDDVKEGIKSVISEVTKKDVDGREKQQKK